MTVSTGVFPVYGMVFEIGTKGRESTEQDMVEIADLESMEITIDGGVENWTPMDTEGWARALMTAKKFNVASVAWKDGLACSTKAAIKFPDGSKLAYDCVLDVKTIYGGESTTVAPLEFDTVGDGKPVYTAGSAA